MERLPHPPATHAGIHSVIRAADEAIDWLIAKGYTNVLVEVANEADNRMAGEAFDDGYQSVP